MILRFSCFTLHVHVGNPGFDSWQGQEISLFSKMSGLPLVPIQPPMQRVQRIFHPWRYSGWGMQMTTNIPSSVMAKNEWSYTSAPPVHIHAVDWDNYTVLWNCIQKNTLHCAIVHKFAAYSMDVTNFVLEVPHQNACAICINPSAWGHLNPSSYCDVGRLFYGVFKLWSKLQRKKWRNNF